MAARSASSNAQAKYAELCSLFFSEGEVSPSEKRGFGATALTIRGRIFAMLARDRLVVKLPNSRVDALVAEGWGLRFDANRGAAMKEWLSVDPSHEAHWRALAQEAFEFVNGG